VNFGTPVPLIVGVILIVGAIALFFLDKIKPGCRRDSDNIYAFLGLLAGVILLAHLGMEFTLSLQQMIMVGMLVSLMIQNIQSRVPGNGPTRQPRERAYREDDDYRPRRTPRSTRMRSEAQLEFDDDPPPARPRRIRGDSERRSRRDNYAYEGGDFADDDLAYPQRSRRRPSSAYDVDTPESYGQGYEPDSYDSYDPAPNRPPSYSPPQQPPEERPRRRRPLQLKGEIEDKTYTPDDYSSAVKAVRNRRRQNTATANDSSDADSTGSNDYGENGNGDYVDYKPLNLPKYPGPPESDNGTNDDGSY